MQVERADAEPSGLHVSVWTMFTFRGPRYETVLTQKQDLPAGARLPDLLRGGDLGPWPAGRTGNDDEDQQDHLG